MKYTLFFLVLPVMLFGQREVVSDSSYIKWESGAWFRVVSQTYDNGDVNLFQTFLGDTATAFNRIVDEIRTASSSRATDINYVSSFPRANRDLLRQSDEFLAKAGINPADSIEVADAAPFLEAGWQVRVNGTSTSITFNQAANKRLRYQNVTTTNRNVDLMGSAIRLRDFPTSGVTTDLYRNPNGKRWVNADRSIQLIPPGGSSQNR